MTDADATQTQSAMQSTSRMQAMLDISLKQGDHKTVFWVGSTKKDTTTGEIIEIAGASYRGEWLDDLKTGYGVQVYKGGTYKYEGQWKDSLKHGEGVLWYQENPKKVRKSYIGQWKLDKRNGKGTAFYANDESYQGDWLQNKREGRGVMKFSDGSVYTGQWTDDKRTGYGHLVKKNGDTYEGYWVNDVKEGVGSLFYEATGKVYVGEWGNDAPVSGCYQQATKNPLTPGVLPVATVIPQLELADTEAVVGDCLKEVRRERLLYRVVHSTLDKLYTNAELAQLEQLFLDQMGVKPFADLEDFRAILKKVLGPDGVKSVSEAVLMETIREYLGFTIGLDVKGTPEEFSVVLSQMDNANIWNFTTFTKLLAILADGRGGTGSAAGA